MESVRKGEILQEFLTWSLPDWCIIESGGIYMSTKAKTRPDRKRTDLSDNSYERRFFELLGNLFIGVPIEGKSGYVNLMRIKSQYYQQVMKPAIQQYVQEQTADFPDYREDLFTKLYTFLKRYIHSETGSLGLFFTPYHESVYERVYTDDRDVMLFWKTSRLYYVKTDILFRSMDVEIGGYKFHFDASQVEHKRNNEKRKLEYRLAGTNGSDIRLTVHYQEASRRRQDETSGDEPSHSTVKDLVAELRSHGLSLTEEVLEQAIRQFEKQSQVDFFICKDAKSFLREQFDLWMWQYLLGSPGSEPDPGLDQEDLRKLQALKRVAYRVIDFIAAFEDELVKIWNKPKFVLNSNYVITIDRIWSRSQDTVRRLLEHPGMGEQVQEWRELGMVDEGFQPAQIVQSGNLIDELHPRYRFLPIDTRYFKDVELEILGLFDHLDEELDGWLIKSENYQALNTILPKWRGKVKCIYIDPPYNTGSDGFVYVDQFQHSTWLSMMHDRLSLAQRLLRGDGVIFASIGDLNPQEGESYRLQALMSNIFPVRFGNLIWRKRGGIGSFSEKNLTENHEYVLVYGNQDSFLYETLLTEEDLRKYQWSDERGPYRWMPLLGPSQQTKDKRPNLNYGLLVRPSTLELVGFELVSGDSTLRDWRHPAHDEPVECVYPPGNATWLIGKDQMWKHYAEGLIHLVRRRDGTISPEIKRYLYRPDGTVDGKLIKSILSDNGYEVGTNADASSELKDICPTAPVDEIKPKPVSLISLLLMVSTSLNDWVMDFFAGSGTTLHALLSLWHETKVRRRFILIEMGDHFENVLLPRAKRLAYSLQWKSGSPSGSRYGISLFFAYLQLEQFEDTLQNAVFTDSALPQTLLNPFEADGKLTHYIGLSSDLDAYVLPWRGADLACTASFVTGESISSLSAEGFSLSGGSYYRWGEVPASLLRSVLWW